MYGRFSFPIDDAQDEACACLDGSGSDDGWHLALSCGPLLFGRHPHSSHSAFLEENV